MLKTIDFYDFFCGCGGTSLGMQNAGLNVRCGIDIDRDSRDTYCRNFPNAKFIFGDIREISVSNIASIVQKNVQRPILFGACAPCQPFSKQNSNKGEGDARRDLLGEFHRFVREFLPDYIFVENVPGLQSVQDSRGPFDRFTKLLAELGYHYDHKVILASHYGVPQSRRRLILIACRHGAISIPDPSHGPNSPNENLPQVWDWISHLPKLRAGEIDSEVPNHRAANLSPLNLRRIAATPIGGDRRNWPKGIGLELRCHKNHIGHTDVYGRMLKDRPSAALTTRCISLSNGRFGHPTQDRAVSVREAACIQTFPIEFEFSGNLNSMARQVGNAVPVLLAETLGESIILHSKRFQNTEVV